MPPKKEQALVHPPSGGKMIFKQSRFEHLPSVPFRCISAGRSGSGKTSALYSAVTDHYRGCFKKIIIIINITNNNTIIITPQALYTTQDYKTAASLHQT